MNIKELIKADFRNVFRDPTLFTAAIAPLLITIVVVFLFPLVEEFVYSRWEVDISEYYRIFSLFMTFIIAMVYGIISAFIMIDERDEDIIHFIKVTPFSSDGYIRYRTGFALLSTTVAVSLYLLVLSAMGAFSIVEVVVLLITIPLEAVAMALVVVSFAGNKVEGLAISKMVGLIPFSAVGAYLVPGATVWLFSIFPPFWIIKAIEAESLPGNIGYGIIALGIHILFIVLCMNRFKRRIALH